MITALLILWHSLSLSSGEWAWNYYPEAEFKILSPFPLQHNIREVPVGDHTILYHQYFGGSLTDSITSMTFVIDHYTVPLSSGDMDSLYYREFFDTTIDQILTSLGGTLVYKDHTSTADGKMCIWKAYFQGEEGLVRGKLMMHQSFYHGMQVFGLQKNKPEPAMNKFLDSFRLLTENEKQVHSKPQK